MEWIVLCQPHYYCFFFAYCKLVTGMFDWSFLAVGLRGIFFFFFRTRFDVHRVDIIFFYLYPLPLSKL